MFKNTASQNLTLYAVDASTGLPKTGDAANMVFYVSKDDGAVTAITSNSGVPTEVDSTNAPGLYKIALSQTETNADKLLFSGKSSTSNIVVVPTTIYTLPANFSTLSIDGSGRVDVAKIAGTSQTARDIGASVLVSVGTGAGQINVSGGKVPATLASTDVTGNVAADLQTIKTQTVTATGAFSFDAQTTAQGTIATNLDATVSSRLAPTTAGRTLDVTATGAAGIDWSNVENPTTAVGLSGTTIKTATDVETDTQDIQSRLPAALVSGRIDASVGAMAADVITATALAASAVSEIQSGLSTLDAAGVRTAVGLTAANLDTQLAALSTDIAAIPTNPLTSADLPSNFGSMVISAAGLVAVQAPIKKNTALSDFEFLMRDNSNHNPATGKTVTVTRSIDGGAFAAGTLSAVTEISSGMYSVDFGAADLNGTVITLRATASNCDDTFVTIYPTP